MNVKLESICKAEAVGVNLGMERRTWLNLEKTLKEYINQCPTRKTKITLGIKNRGNSKQEIGYSGDR